MIGRVQDFPCDLRETSVPSVVKIFLPSSAQ
jgi:hypothetical protein